MRVEFAIARARRTTGRSFQFHQCTMRYAEDAMPSTSKNLDLTFKPSLQQVECSTCPVDDFLLLKRQPYELESIAVTGTITHDTSDSNANRCNRNRKLQANGGTHVPTGGKTAPEAAFVDVQTNPPYPPAFRPQ